MLAAGLDIEPDSFSGGGTTNLGAAKFQAKEGVTSNELGTLGPTEATEFIQEYASKLTEVDAATMKIKGEIKSTAGMVGIDTMGAPNVGEAISGELEKKIVSFQAVAEDAVRRQNIPRRYREHVKKYFDSLRGR